MNWLFTSFSTAFRSYQDDSITRGNKVSRQGKIETSEYPIDHNTGLPLYTRDQIQLGKYLHTVQCMEKNCLKRERGRKKREIADYRKNVQTTCTAFTASTVGPCPTIIQIRWTDYCPNRPPPDWKTDRFTNGRIRPHPAPSITRLLKY